MLRRMALSPGRICILRKPPASLTISSRPIVSSKRCISTFPWKSNQTPSPSAHAYFQSSGAPRRSGKWRRPLGRILFATFAYYCCYQIYKTVVIETLFDWVTDEVESMPDKERQELAKQIQEEDDDLFFLPWPFGLSAVQQPPYKATDPEWKTFLEIRGNSKYRDGVRAFLLAIIRVRMQSMPAYVRLLGGKDIRVSGYWLDIVYPHSPPPKFHIPGLLVATDGLFWTHRPIDGLSVRVLQLALYPKAVALGAWEFCKVLLKQTVREFSSNPNGNGSPNQAPASNTVTVDAQAKGLKEAMPNPALQVAKSLQASSPKSTDQERAMSTVSNSSQGLWSSRFPQLNAPLDAAWLKFQRKRLWYDTLLVPGHIKVEGNVELLGKQNVMNLQVSASYDPKEKTFMTIDITVKRLIPRSQWPSAR